MSSVTDGHLECPLCGTIFTAMQWHAWIEYAGDRVCQSCERAAPGIRGRGEIAKVTRTVVAVLLLLICASGARAQSLVAANAVDARAAAPVLNSTSHQSRVTSHVLFPLRQTRATIADLAKCNGKQFCAEGYSYLGAYTFDMVGTHHLMTQGGYEAGWLFTGTHSTAKVALAYGALTVANFTLAHWMEHSKHRWIRALSSAPLAYGGITHTRAAIGDERWRRYR